MKRTPPRTGASLEATIANLTNSRMSRTTVFLPDILDENLAVLALQEGRSKSDLLRDAAVKILKEKGLNPIKRPKIRVAY